jgi:hypothetical protein
VNGDQHFGARRLKQAGTFPRDRLSSGQTLWTAWRMRLIRRGNADVTVIDFA